MLRCAPAGGTPPRAPVIFCNDRVGLLSCIRVPGSPPARPSPRPSPPRPCCSSVPRLAVPQTGQQAPGILFLLPGDGGVFLALQRRLDQRPEPAQAADV